MCQDALRATCLLARVAEQWPLGRDGVIRTGFWAKPGVAVPGPHGEAETRVVR